MRFLCHSHHKRHVEPLISLLVPFGGKDPRRAEVWAWLERYWRDNLPDSEIVIGHDRRSRKHGVPFSKAVAVNDAFKRSRGDIIVVLDADAYMSTEIISHAAARIRTAQQHGVRMWLIPYRFLFRLTREASDQVLASDPCDPLQFSTPPPKEDVESMQGSGSGQFYGALVQIMPREAFETVGGMDPRFRGWGSEDASFLKSLDTLWAKHTNTANDVLHLWHHKLVIRASEGPFWEVRIWEGQTAAQVNGGLASQYHRANGNKEKMKALVEGR